ncbi:MAG: hypothetical protein ChlgKO_11350 [Chlamydiales bacterium]
MLDYFILAGEVSGDNLGAELIAKLPEKNILAVAGPQMRKTGVEVLFEMEKLETMGFIDVLGSLPRIYKYFKQARQAILKRKPKTVILIDYSDFNLALGKSLRKKGYRGKIVQYVCPSVWAWRKGRIKNLEKNFDLLLSILPFEKEYFKGRDIRVEYIGHPLLAKIQYTPHEKKYLSLFPGSRKTEIERNLPLQIEVAKKHSPYPIAISLSDENMRPLITKLAPGIEIFPKEKRYDLMQQSHAAIATSGTVNLELALYRIPTVVTFAIKPLDLFIAKDLLRIRLDHYSLPNIIAGKTIFPELYGPNLTKENLEQELKNVLLAKESESIVKLLETKKTRDLLDCLDG